MMNDFDIHTLIDYAMKEKTHSVCIFISGDNTSVRIEPFTDSDPRWIVNGHKASIPGWDFECSECHGRSREGTSYCPHCGEKLRMPIEADFKKEATDDGKHSI